ncbi:MAG: putative RND superfamily exporter protein [Verrucomicrobiales bacterium]|jgi:predicted RND superfamily exporter protein
MPPRPLLPRILILLSVSTLLALLTYGVVHRLKFNANPLDLLPNNLPEVAGLKIYQESFASQHDIIVALRPDDPADGEAAARSLAEALEPLVPTDIRRVSWRQPFFTDAEPAQEDLDPTLDPTLESIDEPAEELNPDAGELIAFVWMNQDDESLQNLTARLTEGSSAAIFEKNLDALENAISADDLKAAGYGYDPLGLLQPPGLKDIRFEDGNSNRIQFSTDDGSLRAILIEAAGSNMFDYDQTSAWADRIKEAVLKWHENSPFKDTIAVEVTGRAPYIAEVAQAMVREMNSSIFVTAGIILALFWIMYRRILPLVYLMVGLFVTFVVTLGLGGLVFEEMSAMSVGFAAILIGLAVDYGFVIFQDSLEGEEVCCNGLRKRLFRPIAWAALTTVVVFFGLNLSSLPGAAQLGTMVAIGITVGATTMLLLFTWLITKFCRRPPAHAPAIAKGSKEGGDSPWPGNRRIVLVTLAIILGASSVLMINGLPIISKSPKAVRPKSSKIWDGYQEVMNRLSSRSDSIMVIAAGDSKQQVANRLEGLEKEIAAMHQSGYAIDDWLLPTALWPHPDRLEKNREFARTLSQMKERLKKEADASFFDARSMQFTNEVFDSWGRFAEAGSAAFPDNAVSQWITDKVFSFEGEELAAAGSIQLSSDCTDAQAEAIIQRLTVGEEEDVAGIYLANWNHLSPAIGRLIRHDFYYTILPISVMIVIMLIIVFRDARGTLLSLATLGVSGLLHLSFMSIMGTEWNIINIVAIPLLLGAGLDYSIHMQLAIRRTGNAKFSQQSLGRALLLCGVSTAVGFGSLAFSSNNGLSTLGLVCAVGIITTMLVSVFLLPAWTTIGKK